MHFGGPRDALAAGVGMVHQELAFCDNLSVAENLCLAALPSRAASSIATRCAGAPRRCSPRRARELDVEQAVRRADDRRSSRWCRSPRRSAAARASSCSTSRRAVSVRREAERLFELIERLKQRGVTCIYVSHRMPEIFRLCDTVTVLRDGRHVATRPTASLAESDLVQMMIGRPLAEYFPRHADAPASKEALRVEGLTVPGQFEDVSFTLRAGEVVGLAGLVGAGRSDVASTLFGLEPADARQDLRSRRGRADRESVARDRARHRLRAGGPQATGARARRERTAQHVAADSRPAVAAVVDHRGDGADALAHRLLHSAARAHAERRRRRRRTVGREPAEDRAARSGSPRTRGFSSSTSRRAAWTSARRRRFTR